MCLKPSELCSLLAEIAEIGVMQEAAGALVHVPAIDHSILIDANAVRQHTFLTGPNGERALQLLLDVAGVSVQLIVAPRDLVFPPDTVDSGLGMKIDVADAPPLVSFSEMIRDVNVVEKNLSTEKNVDNVVGALVMLRYFVAGAKRLGIECGDAESTLQRLWERTGLSAQPLNGSEKGKPPAIRRPRTRKPSRPRSKPRRQ